MPQSFIYLCLNPEGEFFGEDKLQMQPLSSDGVCILAGSGAHTATRTELQPRAQPISLFLAANADMMGLHVVIAVRQCDMCLSNNTILPGGQQDASPEVVQMVHGLK